MALPEASRPLESAPSAEASPAGLSVRVERFAAEHRLSPREQQILLELGRGVHPKQIGASVGCSYSSVRTHIRRMSKKLSCSGTRELIVKLAFGDPGTK